MFVGVKLGEIVFLIIEIYFACYLLDCEEIEMNWAVSDFGDSGFDLGDGLVGS